MINILIDFITVEIILVYCCFFVCAIICSFVLQHIKQKCNPNREYGFDLIFTSMIAVSLLFRFKVNEIGDTFLEILLIVICYSFLIALVIYLPGRIIGDYFYRKFFLKKNNNKLIKN